MAKFLLCGRVGGGRGEEVKWVGGSTAAAAAAAAAVVVTAVAAASADACWPQRWHEVVVMRVTCGGGGAAAAGDGDGDGDGEVMVVVVVVVGDWWVVAWWRHRRKRHP